MYVCTAKSCPRGMQYSECLPKIQRTCATLYSVASFTTTGYTDDQETGAECFPGCHCPSGKLLHAGQCVKPQECPCQYQKQFYSAGQSVKIDCNYWSVAVFMVGLFVVVVVVVVLVAASLLLVYVCAFLQVTNLVKYIASVTRRSEYLYVVFMHFCAVPIVVAATVVVFSVVVSPVLLFCYYYYYTTTTTCVVQHVFTRSLAVYRGQLFANLLGSRTATFQDLWRTYLRVSRPTLYILARRGLFYATIYRYKLARKLVKIDVITNRKKGGGYEISHLVIVTDASNIGHFKNIHSSVLYSPQYFNYTIVWSMASLWRTIYCVIIFIRTKTTRLGFDDYCLSSFLKCV